MTLLEEASGNLPWINHTHGGNHVGMKLNGLATVAYTAYVWNVQYPQALPINADAPKASGTGRMYGWKQPELYAEFRRFTALNDWPPSTILLFPELQITGGQRGLGRVGADFWPVYKDRQGRRRAWIWDRYPQSLWHSCNLMSHMLVPGPAGPVASTRYELMREGLQQCEARIAIESVLADEAKRARLPVDLAQQAQQLLDNRVWQELKAFGDMQLTGRSYATAKDTWYYGCGGTAGHYWYARLRVAGQGTGTLRLSRRGAAKAGPEVSPLDDYGEPGGPRVQPGGNLGKIDIPNVIDPFGRDHPLGSLGGSLLDLWQTLRRFGATLLACQPPSSHNRYR